MPNENLKNMEPSTTGQVDWSIYLQEGVIIDLQIKRYRGVSSVDFSELGINEESSTEFKNFLGAYMKPGQKRLIPPSIEGQLKSIETTARNNLKDHSFDCSSFSSQGKFMPLGVYSEFKKTNKELQDRFYTIRDEFACNYDSIIIQLRKDYKILAENLYMQSHPNVKRPNANYVNSFVNKIIEQVPSKEEIVASFEYKVNLNRIPDHLLNVMKKKNNIDERAMKIAASNINGKPTQETEKKVISTEAIKELESDISKSISSQSEAMVTGFVTDILKRLRTIAYEGSTSIIESIEKNDGKLVGRASIKAHSLIEDLRKLDFYGDESLQRLVNTLENTLSVEDGKTRNIDDIKAAAKKMNDWSKLSLDTLTKTNKTRTAKTCKNSTTLSSDAKKTVKIPVPRKNTPKRSIKTR